MNPTKIAQKFTTTIDIVELAVRMAESYTQMKRPPGVSSSQAIFLMEREAQDAWMRTATAAMEYWRECISEMQRTN